MEGNCGNICESNINFLNTCFQQDVRSMCNMGEVDDDDDDGDGDDDGEGDDDGDGDYGGDGDGGDQPLIIH